MNVREMKAILEELPDEMPLVMVRGQLSEWALELDSRVECIGEQRASHARTFSLTAVSGKSPWRNWIFRLYGGLGPPDVHYFTLSIRALS